MHYNRLSFIRCLVGTALKAMINQYIKAKKCYRIISKDLY